MIFAWTASPSRVGYQTLARSEGLSEKDALELEGLFGFFGPPPRSIPAEGIPSFLRVGPDTYAAWRIYAQTHEARGTRDAIWVHAFVFNANELDAMDGDPFALDDAGMFIASRSDVPERLPRVKPPKPGEPRRILERLRSLTPGQVDVLLMAAFCSGYACLSEEGVEWWTIRALRYLVPAGQRGRLTFYGLVTGVPLHKARLVVVTRDCFGRSFDPEAAVTASLAGEQHAGQNATSYASAMASLIGDQAWDRVQRLVALAETLGVDVFGSAADSLVDLFRKQQSFVEGLDATALRQLCQSLRNKENAEAIDKFYGKALLAIAEQAIGGKGDEKKLVESLSVLAEDAERLPAPQRRSAWAVFVDAWNRLERQPMVLPPLLNASRIWPDESADKIRWLVKNCRHYLDNVDKLVERPQDRVVLLEGSLAEARRAGSTALAEWCAAGLISVAIQTAPPEQVRRLWSKYGRWVRSREPARLIWGALTRVTPRAEMWAVVEDLALRTISVGDSNEVAAFLTWATRSPDRLKETCRVAGELCPSIQGKVNVARALLEKGRVHEEDVFHLLMAMEPKARRREPLAIAFLPYVSMRTRFRLAVSAVKSGHIPSRKLHFLFAVLEPSNEEEARCLVEMVRYDIDSVPFWLRGGIYNLLKRVRRLYPLCGAEPLLRVRDAEKRRMFIGILAAGIVTVVAVTGFVFKGEIQKWFTVTPVEGPTADLEAPSQPPKDEPESEPELEPEQGTSAPASDEARGPLGWKDRFQRLEPTQSISMGGGMSILRRDALCEAALSRDPVGVARDACQEIEKSVKSGADPQVWAVAVLDTLHRACSDSLLGLCGREQMAKARHAYAHGWTEARRAYATAWPSEPPFAQINSLWPLLKRCPVIMHSEYLMHVTSGALPWDSEAGAGQSLWESFVADRGLTEDVDKWGPDTQWNRRWDDRLRGEGHLWLFQVAFWARCGSWPEDSPLD